MEISEIEQLISLLGSFGLGAVLGGGIIYFLVKTYIPSYLAEKGKNLATKEDIAGITDQVEGVKIGYAKVLEELRSDNQLKLATIERERGLKKEVYLLAAEAVTRTQNMITSFSNLNIPNENITANLIEDSGVMAKVQIVGSKETVKATTEFMAAIGSRTLDLMLERTVLLDRKTAIEQHEAIRAKAEQEVDRYIEIMKGLNLQGNQDRALWGAIERQVEFEQNQVAEYTKTISELWDSQEPEHIAYADKCMDCFFEISALLPPIILSVRSELELNISPEDYLNIFNKNIDTGRAVFDEFLEKVATSKA